MTEHLPECRLGEPCDIDISEHGFCSMQVEEQFICIHCMGECICERLRACEERATAAAVQRVEALANEMRNWSSAETTAATESVPDLTFDQWLWAQRGVLRSIAAIKGDQP